MPKAYGQIAGYKHDDNGNIVRRPRSISAKGKPETILAIPVSEKFKDQLKTEAKFRKQTMSKMVRNILEDWLNFRRFEDNESSERIDDDGKI